MRIVKLLPCLVGIGLVLGSAACSGGADSEAMSGEKSTNESVGASASPIIGGVSATSYTEAALVDLYQSGRLYAYCSGSVIAPRVVLTAGHCVENITSWKVKTPFASNQTAQASSGAVYDWKTNGSETVDPNLHDIGLVFLSTPISLGSYPALATAKVASGTKGINVGRIQDGSLSTSALFKGAAIALSDGSSSGFPFDYSSKDIIQSGDSGGPVFLSATGTHTILAVNSGAGGSTQVLARVDLLRSWIVKQITSHGGGNDGSGGPATTFDTTSNFDTTEE